MNYDIKNTFHVSLILIRSMKTFGNKHVFVSSIDPIRSVSYELFQRAETNCERLSHEVSDVT